MSSNCPMCKLVFNSKRTVTRAELDFFCARLILDTRPRQYYSYEQCERTDQKAAEYLGFYPVSATNGRPCSDVARNCGTFWVQKFPRRCRPCGRLKTQRFH